jgi:hypothetical protein
MPRKETSRPSPTRPRRPTNGDGVTATPPYVRDPRWSRPVARRRTDVFVVDIADRFATESTSSEDALALTA